MLLSIIIPVYNGERYLEKCIDSIFHQSKELEFEIILIDDASKDKTPSIMIEYQKRYPDKIRIFRNPNNMGVSEARNRGLENACGTWIVFVDADDLLPENFFGYIKENMEYDFAVFDMFMFQEEKELIRKRKKGNVIYYGKQDRNMLIKKMLTEENLVKNHVINLASPWAKIYRKEFIEKHNLRFLKEIKFGEDMLFNIQAIGYQENMVYIPEVAYYYRQHPESTVHSCSREFIKEDKKFSENLSRILQEINVPEDIKNLIYRSAIGGIVMCLHRQVFAKELCLSKEERYSLLDDILGQEPYQTAVTSLNMNLSWKRRIIIWFLRKRWYWAVSFLFCFHR